MLFFFCVLISVFSALEVFNIDALYKVMFYLLIYLTDQCVIQNFYTHKYLVFEVVACLLMTLALHSVCSNVIMSNMQD